MMRTWWGLSYHSKTNAPVILSEIGLNTFLCYDPARFCEPENQRPTKDPWKEINKSTTRCLQVCYLCDTGYYIGYTMRHLDKRVEEHKHKQSSICKHHMSKHGTIPRDLTENITVLRKCKGKFERLLHEMLFKQKEKPPLNIQWFPKGETVCVN